MCGGGWYGMREGDGNERESDEIESIGLICIICGLTIREFGNSQCLVAYLI